jgi:hypothetical protein
MRYGMIHPTSTSLYYNELLQHGEGGEKVHLSMVEIEKRRIA